MEGDTPSFLGLIPNGLEPGDHPGWGGWGGRYLLRQPYGETRPIWTQGGDSFGRVTSADTIGAVTSDQATIWRWREAIQNDFAARIGWSILPYVKANHPPRVTLTRDHGAGLVTEIAVQAGQPFPLDASGSRDPDGNRLSYRWLAYAEAGYEGGHFGPAPVTIAGAARARATLTATATCTPNWLKKGDCPATGRAHVILTVTDNGKPALMRYRRIILTVTSSQAGK